MDVLTGALLFSAGVALSEFYNRRIRKALLGETCLFVRKRKAGRYGMGHIPGPDGEVTMPDYPKPMSGKRPFPGSVKPTHGHVPSPPGTIPPPRRREWTMYAEPVVVPPGDLPWPRYTAEDFNLIGRMAAAAANAVREGASHDQTHDQARSAMDQGIRQDSDDLPAGAEGCA